jgi:hypothetical protein
MAIARYSALTFSYYKGKHYPNFSLNEIQGKLRFRYSIPATPPDIKVWNYNPNRACWNWRDLIFLINPVLFLCGLKHT